MAKYEMLADSKLIEKAKKGTIVYDFKYYDYGCSYEDTMRTNIEHIAVTMNTEGSYPFFTVPRPDLKEIKE